MLILYNKNFKIKNLKNLRKLPKFNFIKNFSKLNKIRMINKFNEINSIIFIQRHIRSKFNDDENCPLTLCKLEYPFISIKNDNSQKKFIYYSLNEFVIYLSKTNNDFIDPMTRKQLSIKTINQISKLVKDYKIKKKISYKNWRKKMQKREEYLTLTNCINDVINQIFSVHILTIDFIYSVIIPQFAYYFHFLLLNHKANCYSLFNNYINCINYHLSENKYLLIDYLNFIITINNL